MGGGFVSSGGTVQDGSISTAKLADASVTSAKLGAGVSSQLSQAGQLAGDALVVGILASSTTGYVPDKAKADAFTSEAGHESTVDTGAGTTAAFDEANLKYVNTENAASMETINTPASLGSTSSSDTTYNGWKIVTEQAFRKLVITKASATTATRALILASDKTTILAQANFSGNTATIVYSGATSTTYYVVVDAAGAGYVWKYGSGSFPYNTATSFNITATLTGGADNTTYYVAIESIDCYHAYSAGAVLTTAYVLSAALPTLNGAITQFKLSTYGLSLAAGAAATFDLDINGDGNYELTGQALNTWITTSQTLAGAKVRLIFAKGSSSTASDVKGWVAQVIA